MADKKSATEKVVWENVPKKERERSNTVSFANTSMGQFKLRTMGKTYYLYVNGKYQHAHNERRIIDRFAQTFLDYKGKIPDEQTAELRSKRR